MYFFEVVSGIDNVKMVSSCGSKHNNSLLSFTTWIPEDTRRADLAELSTSFISDDCCTHNSTTLRGTNADGVSSHQLL